MVFRNPCKTVQRSFYDLAKFYPIEIFAFLYQRFVPLYDGTDAY